MAPTRWRLMAGALAVGLVGLVVFAQDRLSSHAVEYHPPLESSPIVAAGLPVFEPLPRPEPPLTPVTVPLEPLPTPPARAKPDAMSWAAPDVIPSPAPAAPTPQSPEPPMVTPVVSVSSPAPVAVAMQVTTIPWKLSLETGNGQTLVELRGGDESLLRIQSDSLDFSTPSGGIIARGKVVLTGSNLEARCDRATIAWQTGQVALDGGVNLSFKGKSVMQTMRAESVTFRLAGDNQPVEFTTKDVHQIVAPSGR